MAEELGGHRRRLDRIAVKGLLTALDASETALRHDDCDDWAVFGRYGRNYADGVNEPNGTWHFAMYPGGKTSQRWTTAKERLSFAQLKADAWAEGNMRLDHMPTSEEAEVIREVLGIRRRRHLSPEQL